MALQWYGMALQKCSCIYKNIKGSNFTFEKIRSCNSCFCGWLSYLQGDIYQTCLQNVLDSITFLRELGLVINAEKSISTSTKTIVLLGFAISSENMCFALTDEKTENLSSSKTKNHQAFSKIIKHSQ